MQVPESGYLRENRELFRGLQRKLSERYPYVSVLASDSSEMNYRVGPMGITVAESDTFGKRGYVVRVHDGRGYAEYAATDINEESVRKAEEAVQLQLSDMASGFERFETPVPEEEEISFSKSTECQLPPGSLTDREIVERLSSIRDYALSLDDRLQDCSVSIAWQKYSKLFISPKRDLEQNVLATWGHISVTAERDDEVKESYSGYSGMCGLELLDTMREAVPERVKTVCDLLSSEPLVPGTYECVCTPEVTGMIVHEAFGHGVEMDMFVKDRALAKKYMGEYVASPLVSMRDGAASASEVASYFFDDEGTVAHDTLIIDRGRLVAGMADASAAARLGVEPTGNGRRESVERKAYTRMTNTFFEGGTDTPEQMIASVKDGLLLGEPTSGMEDPKNWGIQCMVGYAREIKDGKLTGRIFSPIVLSGYVPDLLKSITMMSPNVELSGSGACGKGYKEWVKVSDGGPWIKARIRLG